jgi:hypothetical protein
MPDEKKKTLQQMSDQELTELSVRLQEQKVELKRARFVVARERNRRHDAALAKARLDKMTDSEKAALAQAIAAESVESGEAVGTPG